MRRASQIHKGNVENIHIATVWLSFVTWLRRCRSRIALFGCWFICCIHSLLDIGLTVKLGMFECHFIKYPTVKECLFCCLLRVEVSLAFCVDLLCVDWPSEVRSKLFDTLNWIKYVFTGYFIFFVAVWRWYLISRYTHFFCFASIMYF